MNLTHQPYQESLHLAQYLISAANSPAGGATLNRTNYKNFRPEIGGNFWLIGGAAKGVVLPKNVDRDPEAMVAQRYVVARWIDQLDRNIHWLGSWFNEDDGLVYYDAVTVTQDAVEAGRLALARDEKAVYLMNEGGEGVIPTENLVKRGEDLADDLD